ncbi:MAG: type IV toxin-antitoxin system AbiEi family antitoxin domain-containing protein [Elusimicrobiota bacterium]|nr:type IV toxin-antitoxin system AbiEi family antitoxin domain-containing protein [Elusimicrobiota bacterium]
MKAGKKTASRRGRKPRDWSAQLAKLGSRGVFTRQEAIAAGLPPAAVARLAASGAINRVGRKLFVYPDCRIDPGTLDFVVACETMGVKAAIGGLSALFHYNLTNQAPVRIWLLVPAARKTSNSIYRLLRTTAALTLEVISVDHYRIVTLERAIVEAFRYSTKIGLETAFAAAKAAITERRTTPAKILKAAQRLNLEPFILKHWEALLALEGPA